MSTIEILEGVKRTRTAEESADLLQVLSPELIDAILDFKHERASGTIEIHFSQGGIAKVYGKPTKMYK